MVRSNKEAKEKWAAYFKAGLAKQKWDAMAFVRASDNRFTYKSANNWEAGRAVPDGDTVAEIADLFGDDESVALEAASLPILASRLARNAPQAPRPVQAEPLDRGLALIKARNLPPEREAAVIERYRRRMNLLIEDLADSLDVLIERRNGTEGDRRDDSRPA